MIGTGFPFADTSRPLRVALTADLHYGTRHSAGQKATEDLAQYLVQDPPDTLILAGDIGTAAEFEKCLALFDKVNCTKALVPGNHDLWVNDYDARGNSLKLFREYLPNVASNHGFKYLDRGPLVLMEADLAIVGTVNWYDYSWSIDQLPGLSDNWEEHLKAKRFSRGRHNDANFIRWPLDDAGFTQEVVKSFEKHLCEALNLVGNALVVTHHPPLTCLNYPHSGPITLDGALWLAFSGNSTIEAMIQKHLPQVAAVFCGHTHKAVQASLGCSGAYNIGGDYGWKRLLMYEWPSRQCTAYEFVGEEKPLVTKLERE